MHAFALPVGVVTPPQMFELYPSNKFILRGEDYTVCSRWGVCVVKLQPSFGGEFWILGDVFIEASGIPLVDRAPPTCSLMR